MTGTMAGTEGLVNIDAQIVGAEQKVFIGSLKYEPVSEDVAKTIYGKPENWKPAEFEYAENTLQYEDKHIYMSLIDHIINLGVNESESEEMIDIFDTQKQREIAQGFLDKFNLLGTITENKLFTRDGTNYYDIQMFLEDVPVAELSQVYYRGYVQFYNGILGGMQLPQKLSVQTSEEAELLSMEKIMELAVSYVESGEISTYDRGYDITEIRLEYYIDKTASGIVCHPIWTFELSSGEDYFYIEATTGALIRDLWGWG